MYCCCLPFRRAGKVSKDDNEHFLNDNYAVERAVSVGLQSHCNCNHLDQPYSVCSCETPMSAAALMKKSRAAFVTRHDNNKSSDDPLSLVLPPHLSVDTQMPLTTLSKIPSTSTQSYMTAKSSNPSDEGTDEIDFTDDTCVGEDDSQELRYSIDAAEASNIMIPGQKEFYETVYDSPLKYQDRFGRSQSMRRYSSAITDRHALISQQQQQQADSFVDLETEPLELSCQYTEESTTIFQQADATTLNDKFSYVDELCKRLPEIRSNLRPTTFPKFNRPEDIRNFLASSSVTGRQTASADSSVNAFRSDPDATTSPQSYSTAPENSPLVTSTHKKPNGGPDASINMLVSSNIAADGRIRRNSD